MHHRHASASFWLSDLPCLLLILALAYPIVGLLEDGYHRLVPMGLYYRAPWRNLNEALQGPLGATLLRCLRLGVPLAIAAYWLRPRLSRLSHRPVLVPMERFPRLAGLTALALAIGLAVGLVVLLLTSTVQPWLRDRLWLNYLGSLVFLVGLAYPCLLASAAMLMTELKATTPRRRQLVFAAGLVLSVPLAWLWGRLWGDFGGGGQRIAALSLGAALTLYVAIGLPAALRRPRTSATVPHGDTFTTRRAGQAIRY